MGRWETAARCKDRHTDRNASMGAQGGGKMGDVIKETQGGGKMGDVIKGAQGGGKMGDVIKGAQGGGKMGTKL